MAPSIPKLPSLSVPPTAVMNAGLALRSFARRATDRPLPAEAILIELSMGFTITRMLAAVSQLGIADQLANGPRTAAEIATVLELDKDAVHRVLRALGLYDVTRLDDDGRFSLTRVGKLLCADDPNGMAAWLSYLNEDSTQEAWARIGESLRDGQPCFPAVHGMSVWDYFAAHPDEGAQFGTAMRRLTQIDAPLIVGSYPWPQTGTVCDVAGGVGTVLAAILQARPNLKGILIDHPDVLAEAGPFLNAVGVSGRVERSPGDMFKKIDAAADIYCLKDVLHDWDDSRCLKILKTVRKAANPGATIVLVEALQERNVVTYPTSWSDVHMLTQCDGGRQRSESELHALLRGAGFTPGKTYPALAASMVTGLCN